jgi:hypothetical protein|tara:strand:- start:10106 stop:10210 length:105 start_codon:yes stop_codon:yes gene_type:complete
MKKIELMIIVNILKRAQKGLKAAALLEPRIKIAD